MDEDGNPFSGLVQYGSALKRWKLVGVCVCVCLFVVVAGLWGPLSCLSYVQRTFIIRLKILN